WIAIEAIRRLSAPIPVLGGPMLTISVLGLAVNLIAFALLRGGARHNIGIAGALTHVVGDLLGSIATIAAAGVILTTGWTPIDPILSLAVSTLILKSGWQLLRRSGHTLLEGTPEDIDPAEVARAAAEVAGVAAAHHVHVWSLSSRRRLATLHVRLAKGSTATQDLAAGV